MTIARLYQYLRTTNFFDLTTTKETRIALIRNNQILPVSSLAEAKEYLACMGLPAEIVAHANHTWALELSYVAQRGLSPDAIDWLVGELQGRYTRRYKYKVQKSLPIILFEIEKYSRMGLQNAIDHVYSEQETRGRGHNPAAASAGPDLARATENYSELARDALQMINTLRQVAETNPERLRQALAENPLLAPTEEAQQTTSSDPGERWMPAKEWLRKMSLHLEKNDSIGLYYMDPKQAGRPCLYFLERSKLDAFKALFSEPVSQMEEENGCSICNMCMAAKATHSCGNEKCEYITCADCFHTWHSDHEKCPGCRRDYIPLQLQGSDKSE